MKIIGITGGVGAGKTEVLAYISKHYNCRVILADQVGNAVKKPGEKCYEDLVRLLGSQILNQDKTINKEKMAENIFAGSELLEQVNRIIHPAVTEYILREIETEKQKGQKDFFFVEAALLIECGYDKYTDEMWYIYADKQERYRRLKESRNYSDEKIENVMKKQLSEEQFKKACKVHINNSFSFEQTKIQIDKILGEELWKMQKNIPDN